MRAESANPKGISRGILEKTTSAQPTESHGNRGCATSTTQKQGEHADTASSHWQRQIYWRNRRYESKPRGKETLSPNPRKPINIYFLMDP